MPCSGCDCEESKSYVEYFEYQRLLQFLMGLNESYAQSSNQILNMPLIPSINKAYSMIISEENRRSLANHSSNIAKNHEGTTLFTSKGHLNSSQFANKSGHTPYSSSPASYSPRPQNHNQVLFNNKRGSYPTNNFKQRKNQLYCDYCNFKGHTRKTCYKLNGYPSDFKSKKKYPSANSVAYTGEIQFFNNHVGGTYDTFTGSFQ
uniref:Uncharacterized protein LOC104216749 n=1 Tax=Nicotiana sylvestris TaxID=4096 RepID=A0A1U7VS07_NICSY|nr:PREDICTED: uncharacterized protein LOC104216749 [Nicotiana sylvestris]